MVNHAVRVAPRLRGQFFKFFPVFAMKQSRSEFLNIRGLQYHLRHWGEEGAPKLFMFHGWMDMSASFQFVVDQLTNDWHVIAPDWRGFGLTDRTHADCYWFPDYLGDMDAILSHFDDGQPINLLGHSMGANVVMLYGGVRPEKIRRLINLEGFGLAPSMADSAPQRYAKWLDELKHRPEMRYYENLDQVTQRLQKNNARLSAERAGFLAQHWSRQNESDMWEILGDPAHKLSNPVLYRAEEVLACWKNIQAPVLWVEAEKTDVWKWLGGKEAGRDEIDRRIASIPKVQTHTIMDAGHMLHHDQPEVLAQLIEQFLV